MNLGFAELKKLDADKIESFLAINYVEKEKCFSLFLFLLD